MARTIEVTLQINGRDFSGRAFEGAAANVKHLANNMKHAADHGTGLGHALEHMGHHMAHLVEHGAELLTILTGLSAISSFGVLAESVKQAGERMAHLYQQSLLLGMTVQQLRELKYVTDQQGIAWENVETTLRRVGALYGGIQAGSAKMIDKVAAVDPKLEAMLQNATDVASAHEAVVKRLSELPQAQRLAEMKSLGFGRDPTLAREASDYEEREKLREQVRQDMGVITQEQARGAEEFDRSQKRLRTVFSSMAEKIAVDVAPTLTQMVDAIRRFIVANRQIIETRVTEWAKRLAAWAQSVDWNKIGRVIGELTSELGTLIGWIGKVASTLGTVIEALNDFDKWLRHIIPDNMKVGPGAPVQSEVSPPGGNRNPQPGWNRSLYPGGGHRPPTTVPLPPSGAAVGAGTPTTAPAPAVPGPSHWWDPWGRNRGGDLSIGGGQSADAPTPPAGAVILPFGSFRDRLMAGHRQSTNIRDLTGNSVFDRLAAVLSRLTDALFLILGGGEGGSGLGSGAGGGSEGGGYGGGGFARSRYRTGLGGEDRADRAGRVYNPGHGAEDRADRATLEEPPARGFAGSGRSRSKAVEHFRGMAGEVMQRLQRDVPGYSKEDYAAALGNLGHESMGFTAYQEGRPRSGRGGAGWAQWTGPRRRAFEAWAAKRGLDPRNDASSYAFLTSMSGEGRQFRHALDETHRASGFRGKVVAFEQDYEGAGVKGYGSRENYGRLAFNAPEPREISAVGFADARGGHATGAAQAHKMELGRGQVDVNIKLDHTGAATTSVRQHAGGAFALNTGTDMTGRRSFVPGNEMHAEPLREPWQGPKHAPGQNAPTMPIRKSAGGAR